MEATKQFCTIKSLQEAQKEMEETTKKELEKLHERIKNHPELLKSSKSSDDEMSLSESISEEDDDNDSDYVPSSSDTSDSEDSQPKIHLHYNRNKKKNIKQDKTQLLKKEIMESIKKDIELDSLEQKNHFKNLELNNLSLENFQQKTEIEKLKKVNMNQEQILNFIVKFLEYKTIKYFENYKEEQINSINELKKLTLVLIDLQKKYESFESLSKNLVDELNKIEFTDKNIKIKDCYYILIDRIMMKNYKNYLRLKDVVNKQIDNLQTTNTPIYMMLLMTFFVIVYFMTRVF